MKIVINKCYGGFGLSDKVTEYLLKNKVDKKVIDDIRYSDNHRTNKILIEAVELLGIEANGRFADLSIIEIPDNIEFTIEEYDGVEWVAEKHRTWR